MSGRELADEGVRRRPKLKIKRPAYPQNAIVHHGRLDPGVHLISKPFSYADFARKIRAVMHGKED
jgi:hypothetical protein